MTTTVRAASLAALLALVTPTPAHADFLVEPFFAWTRNKETARWVSGGGAAAEWTAGWLLVGGEFGYAGGYFDPPADALDLIASSHVLTIMGHAGVGLPSRDGDTRIAPYFTGGFGAMRQDARDRAGLVSVKRTDPALHFGGGVRVLINSYLGIRGDARYFRSMKDPFEAPDPIVADLERLDFWRLSLGAVIRFGN